MRQLLLLSLFFFFLWPLAGAGEPFPATDPTKLTPSINGADPDLSGRQEVPSQELLSTVPGELPPLEIQAVFPSVVDACSLQQGRTIALSGRFPAEARVLLDGAVIPAETTRAGEATFVLPPAGGRHAPGAGGRWGERA